MTFKKFGIILFLMFSLLPIQKTFAQTPNTGFVSGNIWYSKDPFEEGDKIQILTFIYNPDARELSGTVFFFDKTVLLGKKDFAIAPKTANDISINWTVTAGDHEIFGKIENAKFLISKGNYEETYLSQNETEKSSRSVSKKITTKTPADTKTDTITNTIGTSVQDVTKAIKENTPNFITKPIVSTANGLESIRDNLSTSSENKKEDVKKEIDKLNSTKSTPDSNKTTSPLLKPFKYVELFLLTISSFILNNKIIFYGLIAIAVFFILRFIWNKVF